MPLYIRTSNDPIGRTDIKAAQIQPVPEASIP